MALIGHGDDCQAAWKHLYTDQCASKWGSGQETPVASRGPIPMVASMGPTQVIFQINLNTTQYLFPYNHTIHLCKKPDIYGGFTLTRNGLCMLVA